MKLKAEGKLWSDDLPAEEEKGNPLSDSYLQDEEDVDGQEAQHEAAVKELNS